MRVEHPSLPPVRPTHRSPFEPKHKWQWIAGLNLTSNTSRMSRSPHRDPRAGAGPWRVDPEFLDESFTSIINSIPLVETVPELAVEEASFILVASSCGPPPQAAIPGPKRRRATPPTRAGAAVPR